MARRMPLLLVLGMLAAPTATLAQDHGHPHARAIDFLDVHGYLTLAPDYRNHSASDSARSFFHIGYAEDVLHLIASIPSLEQADPRRVGLWGHSMGGGIALKTAVVSKSVDALVLFGSVSGDERVNYANGMGNGPGVYGIELMGSPRSNPTPTPRRSWPMPASCCTRSAPSCAIRPRRS